MTDNPFFDHPILNSPYEYPARYWELDETGQPTQQIINARRQAEFITPIPKPKKRKKTTSAQAALPCRTQRASPLPSKSTTPSPSSTSCAAISILGGHSRIPAIGA